MLDSNLGSGKRGRGRVLDAHESSFKFIDSGLECGIIGTVNRYGQALSWVDGPQVHQGPDSVQGKQTQPARDMNGAFVRVIIAFGNVMRNAVEPHQSIDHHGQTEAENAEAE